MELVELLMKSGSILNIGDNDGMTPLERASYNEAWELARVMIENYGNINAKDIDGRTLLHGAYWGARLLIENGADANSKDNYGRTPLHDACQCNGRFVNIINLLIENGSQVNEQDNEGNTPLHMACWYGNVNSSMSGPLDGVKLLLNRGADVTIQNLQMETPLHHACRVNNSEVVFFLVRQYPSLVLKHFE